MQPGELQNGRYRSLQLIGSGSMGDVYLAEDARIRRQVAIKVIRSEAIVYPDSSNIHDAARLFEQEARTIAIFNHPYILPLYDFGEEKNNGVSLMYMVMPFCADGTLATWLRERSNAGPLLPRDTVHFISQAASALQHAHDRQIIHRDVKPSNFLIRSNRDDPNYPDLLLADFGIARFAAGTTNTSRTIRGTPTYMAPELWIGVPVPASDQYALAIMAYEMLVGRSPFQGSLEQMMYQHIHAQPHPPSQLNPNLSSDVDSVFALALAKRPATVPSGQPSWRAASLRPLPSRSHRTTTARYLSGRRLNSWSRIGCRSGQGSLSVTAGSGMEVTCLSRSFLRAAVLAA